MWLRQTKFYKFFLKNLSVAYISKLFVCGTLILCLAMDTTHTNTHTHAHTHTNTDRALQATCSQLYVKTYSQLKHDILQHIYGTGKHLPWTCPRMNSLMLNASFPTAINMLPAFQSWERLWTFLPSSLNSLKHPLIVFKFSLISLVACSHDTIEFLFSRTVTHCLGGGPLRTIVMVIGLGSVGLGTLSVERVSTFSFCGDSSSASVTIELSRICLGLTGFTDCLLGFVKSAFSLCTLPFRLLMLAFRLAFRLKFLLNTDSGGGWCFNFAADCQLGFFRLP